MCGGPPASGKRGWHGPHRIAQASLDALAKHGGRWADRPKCRCGSVALSGRDKCYRHTRRRTDDKPVSPMRAAGRELWRRMKAGQIPDALQAMDVFQRTWNAPLRYRPACLALSDAWPDKDNNPLAWVDAVRQAREVLANG